MSFNIFQIWDSIGRKTPFAVRRDNWTEDYYTVVENIECENLPYGKAFGYSTINGEYSNHYEYSYKWRSDKIIPCCGCYQWTLVENVDLNKYKEGVDATVKSVKGAFTINSHFYYGKYKDMTVDEVFRMNSGYIEWAVKNNDKFFLSPETLDYLDKLKPDFKFSDEVRKANNEKVLIQQQKQDLNADNKSV